MDSIQTDVYNISQIPIIPNLLEVICRTTGMGFAAVARVSDEKWVACSVRDEISFGLVPGGELVLETTICNEIRQSRVPVIIDHVAEDKKYCDHHTPRKYGFQSYISIPILRKDGSFFGTLCAIDPKPHRLNTPEISGMFNLFADLISFHLLAIEKVTVTESELLEEQKTAELREQFIAILGHDLRNPLSAITFSTELLREMPLDNESSSLVNIISKSSRRMAGLIKNTLDFARGRLGGGIILHRIPEENLETILRDIIVEHQTARPQSKIKFNFEAKGPVFCDGNRIAELLSNLLGNALTYGKPEEPVYVNALICDEQFVLSVINNGNKIPAGMMDKLFHPFVRGEQKSGKEGLGLGLFIASEIARSHDGSIDVISHENETRFILKIPIRQKKNELN